MCPFFYDSMGGDSTPETLATVAPCDHCGGPVEYEKEGLLDNCGSVWCDCCLDEAEAFTGYSMPEWVLFAKAALAWHQESSEERRARIRRQMEANGATPDGSALGNETESVGSTKSAAHGARS